MVYHLHQGDTMKTTLLTSLLAAAFGLAVNGAIAQQADMPDPQSQAGKEKYKEGAETQAPAAAGSESTPGATQSEDAVGGGQAGTDPSADSKEQSNIPDQSQGTVGHPEQRETTGQGQGVKESGGTAEAKPPTDSAMPDQGTGAAGQDESTGQAEKQPR
jgi:hypothetical protein